MASKPTPIIPPATRTILDGLASQFYLSEARLLEITAQITKAFDVGLRDRSQGLAMM